MGRKPKCTVEEKISAVEDYLNGIRSVSEIMIDLSIKSTRTIRNWILAYQNGGIEALCSVTANHSYSSEFKIEMVRKYINGEGSVTDLCARYGIPAHATLQNWISLYNANRELRDYDPKREVYMAEARRKTTLEERKEMIITWIGSLFIGRYDGFYGPGTGTFLILVFFVLLLFQHIQFFR